MQANFLANLTPEPEPDPLSLTMTLTRSAPRCWATSSLCSLPISATCSSRSSAAPQPRDSESHDRPHRRPSHRPTPSDGGHLSRLRILTATIMLMILSCISICTVLLSKPSCVCTIRCIEHCPAVSVTDVDAAVHDSLHFSFGLGATTDERCGSWDLGQSAN